MCEEVAGGQPTCFAPVHIVGRVFDYVTDDPIPDARVVARYVNGQAVSPVAITQAPPKRNAEAPAPSRQDRDALAGYSQWPLHRHGTVELSLRPRQGTLRPISTATFVDTDGGRYLTFSEPLPDGGFRLHFTPSTGTHLRKWLLETIEEGVR